MHECVHPPSRARGGAKTGGGRQTGAPGGGGGATSGGGAKTGGGRQTGAPGGGTKPNAGGGGATTPIPLFHESALHLRLPLTFQACTRFEEQLGWR